MTHPHKDALAKVREHLEAICKGSCYDLNWQSDGQDYDHANKALSHLAQIEQGLEATQRPEVETVTVEELMNRINHSHYNYTCMVAEIARVFPNGLRIVKGGE